MEKLLLNIDQNNFLVLFFTQDEIITSKSFIHVQTSCPVKNPKKLPNIVNNIPNTKGKKIVAIIITIHIIFAATGFPPKVSIPNSIGSGKGR